MSSTTRESKSIVSNIVQKYQDKEVESNTSEYGLVEGGVNLEDIDDKLDRELKEEIEDIKRKIELKEIEVPDSSTSLETFLNTKDKEWDEQKWNFRLHRFNAELDMDRKCSELWYYVQTGRMKMGSDERCTCVWI